MPTGRWTGLVIISIDLEHLQNGSACSKLRSRNASRFVHSQNPPSSPSLYLCISEKHRITGMASSLDWQMFPSQSRGALVSDHLPHAAGKGELRLSLPVLFWLHPMLSSFLSLAEAISPDGAASGLCRKMSRSVHIPWYLERGHTIQWGEA